MVTLSLSEPPSGGAGGVGAGGVGLGGVGLGGVGVGSVVPGALTVTGQPAAGAGIMSPWPRWAASALALTVIRV
ncbi:hypothetical protein C8263_11390 [Deinococcus arcticus]|uniref:Uncharacterized protein n=1 Tax=Deinococcus arcticus TaxID=2136176 RepID=A0A2T3W730_9DEIO|nr:hypothetical protein C8263_11390 [Deinococcus arcticus]